MFDMKFIRDNAQAFDAGMAKRGLGPQAERLITLDDKRRAQTTATQELQTRRNSASKEIGKAKAAKDDARAQTLMDEVASLKAELQAGEEAERALNDELRHELASLPNLPMDDVPEGADEADNVLVRTVGEPVRHAFGAKEHFELGEALGLMDFEAAAKMSGARFVVLSGALARLERALAQFMLNRHTAAADGQFAGYTEVVPPMLVRDNAMFGTSQLPKFAEDLYSALSSVEASLTLEGTLAEALKPNEQVWGHDTPEAANRTFKRKARQLLSDGHWLIPTAEVPLTNLVREQTVDAATLPRRYTAHTPCFRSEAGAAGRDTRGMIRQHQFSKVELVSVTTPEESEAELERMTANAERVLQDLGLSYRVMLLCAGDMGFGARKTYDIEVWLPGQNAYREISSCSVCGDFQARRMGARLRKPDEKDLGYVHTLNGSGLAVGRTLIAVLETYQREDGTIDVPEVLQPYMGGVTRIEGV